MSITKVFAKTSKLYSAAQQVILVFTVTFIYINLSCSSRTLQFLANIDSTGGKCTFVGIIFSCQLIPICCSVNLSSSRTVHEGLSPPKQQWSFLSQDNIYLALNRQKIMIFGLFIGFVESLLAIGHRVVWCLSFPYVLPVFFRLSSWWVWLVVISLPLRITLAVSGNILFILLASTSLVHFFNRVARAVSLCLAVLSASAIKSLLYFLGAPLFTMFPFCSSASWLTSLRVALILASNRLFHGGYCLLCL